MFHFIWNGGKNIKNKMSRSIRNRHNKYGVNLKISGNSDKKSKRIANRKFRRKETLEEKNTLILQLTF